MANIKPTRAELITLRKKVKLAKTGHSLLKKKVDGLRLEIYRVLKHIKALRSTLVKEYQAAEEKINKARVIDSDVQIKSVALAVAEETDVQIDVRSIMGVKLSRVQGKTPQTNPLERGYGFFSGSVHIDEATNAYEVVLKRLIELAEVELTLRKLLIELKKTTRKVNALEKVTIPGMERDTAYIRFRLEELERENFSRLKHIKRGLA